MGMEQPDFFARYLRQIILPEVGEAGQRRLARATARVAAERGAIGGDLAHEWAVRYAERVGFGNIAGGPIPVDALAPEHIVKHDACRALLAGSRAVVAAMQEVLLAGGARESRPAGADAN
jgi:hypothetical protein